jgi:hypothetical protein
MSDLTRALLTWTLACLVVWLVAGGLIALAWPL